MIGAVERRNAILRIVMEKLIDQWAAKTSEDVEFLLTPALHALNSSTFTRGRRAFQAGFGRVPRLPGGVITDDTSITTNPSTLNEPNNLLAKVELARSEAQRHLLELNVSQQLRRALLRKTSITRYPNFQPGQPCAYWRWQRKGVKKRGSWIISRVLSWDPSAPQRLAWVRGGNGTTLVSVEQLRAATGFESWSPSDEIGPEPPAMMAIPIPPAPAKQLAAAPGTPTLQPLPVPPQQQHTETTINTHMESPTFQQTLHQEQHNINMCESYGPPPRTSPRTPRTPRRDARNLKTVQCRAAANPDPYRTSQPVNNCHHQH